MKIFVTDAAKADLRDIGAYIHLHNPTRAVTFIEEILDRCDALADMPEAYPLVPRYEQWGIRRRVHRDYLIFYRVRHDHVEIIHILHGARDYEALLFPES